MNPLDGISDTTMRIDLRPEEIGFLQAALGLAVGHARRHRYGADWFEAAKSIQAKIDAQFAAQAGPR